MKHILSLCGEETEITYEQYLKVKELLEKTKPQERKPATYYDVVCDDALSCEFNEHQKKYPGIYCMFFSYFNHSEMLDELEHHKTREALGFSSRISDLNHLEKPIQNINILKVLETMVWAGVNFLSNYQYEDIDFPVDEFFNESCVFDEFIKKHFSKVEAADLYNFWWDTFKNMLYFPYGTDMKNLAINPYTKIGEWIKDFDKSRIRFMPVMYNPGDGPIVHANIYYNYHFLSEPGIKSLTVGGSDVADPNFDWKKYNRHNLEYQADTITGAGLCEKKNEKYELTAEKLTKENEEKYMKMQIEFMKAQAEGLMGRSH